MKTISRTDDLAVSKKVHSNNRSTKLKAKWFWYALDIIPVLLPVGIASFGAVGTLLLLFGQLKSAYVWPAGLLVAIVAMGIVTRYYRDDVYKQERRLCNLFVWLGVLLWGAFNVEYSSQHIITNRDPGTYANAGAWLIHHASLSIPISNIFGNVPGVSPESAGFAPETIHGHTYIYAQGLHLLPIYLGLAGRIVGVKGMFHVNILFGITALLAIYALCRLLARPFWAMVVTGAVAASMPFLYFSRDTYTELLAATFTFGALTLLFMALKTKKPSLWFLVGLITGAGTLSRIDGFLTIAAMLIFLVVMLALAKPRDRISAIHESVAAVIGIAVTATLGWLDLYLLSRPYLDGTEKQFRDEIALNVLVVVAGAIVIYLSWQTKFLRKLDTFTSNWRSIAVAFGIIAITIFLASRPLWLSGKAAVNGDATQWVQWYAGPLLAILGLIGLSIQGARLMKQRNLLLLATFLVVIVTSLVYITAPNIAADQIWASRRLVPVILPGIAIFGAITIDWIDRRYSQELSGRWRNVGMILLAAALLIGPLLTSRPEVFNRDTDLLQPMENICNALPNNSAVVWLGLARTQLIQPTRSICGDPSVGYGPMFSVTATPSTATLAALAQNIRAQGLVPVVGVPDSQASGVLPPYDVAQLNVTIGFNYNFLQEIDDAPPVAQDHSTETIQMGLIQSNGMIAPLP